MRIRLQRPRRHAPIFIRRGRMRQGERFLIIVMLIALILIAIAVVSIIRLEPIVISLARSESRERVIRAVNSAVSMELDNGNLDYGRLVTLEKDGSGNITALVTNSALINIMQTRISDNVVDCVENIFNTNMTIPIGNAFGGVVFAGRGPGIPVKIQSVSSVETKFTNDFSSSGINQTRHKIMLEITVGIEVIIPGNREITNVTTELAVAETVIVGVVPNIYADIGGLNNGA